MTFLLVATAIVFPACADEELDELEAAEGELSDEDVLDESEELAAPDAEVETTGKGGNNKGNGQITPCAVVKCGFGAVCEVVKGQAVCVEPKPDPCAATTCPIGTACESKKNGKVACVPVDGEQCGDVFCGDGTVCCNASCGICTEPGGFCIQLACE